MKEQTKSEDVEMKDDTKATTSKKDDTKTE